MGKFYKLRRAKMVPKIMGVVILGLCSNTAFSYWGDPVKLPDKINRAGNVNLEVDNACISPDGQYLYFTVLEGTWDQIWVARWNGTDWDSITKLGPNINGPRRTLSPSVTADGKKLYFVCYGRPGGYGSYDVWYSEWQDTCWGPAKNCGPNVNTAGMEFTAFISPDGRKLYFSRYGARGLDILCSEWDSINNEWGPAYNIGSPISTSANEDACWVSADDKTLYFHRWGWGKDGDIYVSYRDGNEWTQPQKLGPPISTPHWDSDPSLSPDQTKLYFASNRHDTIGGCKLWVSEWIPIEVLPWSQDSSGFVGDTIWYSVRVRNDGEEDASFDLKVVGNKWSATIWDSTGTKQISSTGIVPPDKEAKLIVKVVIPERLSHSAVDSMRIYATLVKGEPSIITDYAKIKTIGKLVYSVPFLESFEDSEAYEYWILNCAKIDSRWIYGSDGSVYDGKFVLSLSKKNCEGSKNPNPTAVCRIDLGEEKEVILDFYWRVMTFPTYPLQKVWLDIYNGSNWYIGVDSLQGEDTGWQHVVVDLSPYSIGKFVTLRFRASRSKFVGSYAYVDLLGVYRTGIEEADSPPEQLSLSIFPNPLYRTVNIYYTLPECNETKLIIYDIVGRPIRVLTSRWEGPGRKEAIWDGKDETRNTVPNGIYFCVLSFGQKKIVRKIVKLN